MHVFELCFKSVPCAPRHFLIQLSLQRSLHYMSFSSASLTETVSQRTPDHCGKTACVLPGSTRGAKNSTTAPYWCVVSLNAAGYVETEVGAPMDMS
uniref:Uncharacterized protein n=1 Tax=Arion vulgaris TaxID=1028688 RepID=A0A0B7BD76_9EUPU